MIPSDIAAGLRKQIPYLVKWLFRKLHADLLSSAPDQESYNLNTHSGDSFYAAFPAAEASRTERPHPLGAHAETRELAERRGTGVQCVAPPVFGSPDQEQGFGHVGNGGLGPGLLHLEMY